MVCAGEPELRRVSLPECVQSALQRNRALQIERINPLIARMLVSESQGVYDPVLTAQLRQEDANEPGGFDPNFPERDSTYSVDSDVADATISGLLPSGLSYSLGANYAHSEGVRNGMYFDSYDLGARITARQPLLRNFWTDQARTTIKVNRKLLRISELGVEYLVMDTVNQVQQAYYELAFAWEDLSVRQRLLRAKEDTLASIRRQVEVGTLTALEEKLAQSQAAQVEASLVQASNVVLQAENMLKTLLGYDASDWANERLHPSDHLLLMPETFDLGQSWRRGFVQRPDLGQMREDLERAEIDVRFRINQLFPSLDLVGSYGRQGADVTQFLPPVRTNASFSAAYEQIEDGEAPSSMVGLVFSTPLSLARERARYRAGKHLRDQARLRVQQKEELILREISDAMHSARLSFDRALAARRAREFARAALQAEEQKLAGGKSSLYFVLQLQGDAAATESAEVRARADYNRAVSQLHFAEGTLIEKAGLRFEKP